MTKNILRPPAGAGQVPPAQAEHHDAVGSDEHAEARDACSETVLYLSTLFALADETDLIEVRAIHRSTHAVEQGYLRRGDILDIERAARQGATNYDVYVGVQPRFRCGGTGADVARIVTLVADVDVGHDKACASLSDAYAVMEQFTFMALAPSMIVESGGGLHAYWLLSEPLPITRADSAVEINTFIAGLLGTDNISDTARVRLPGTLNHKIPGSPRPVRLGRCHPEQRYTIDDVRDRLPRVPHIARRRHASTSGIRVHGSTASAGLVNALSPRLQRVMDATGWSYRLKYDRDGRVNAIILADCPACAADATAQAGAAPDTAHISPLLGTLRCKRAKCPAGPTATGATSTTWYDGIPLEAWVDAYAPHAVGAFARPSAPAPAPDEVCAIDDVEVRLAAMVREAIAWSSAVPGRAALISSTTGVGKTHGALRALAARPDRGTLLAQSHRALDERATEGAQQGLRQHRRYHGLLSMCDTAGRPICRYAPSLRPWAERGFSIRTKVCPHCPDRDNYAGTGTKCQAFLGAVGLGTRFATHAHAPALGREGALSGPIIVDELPQLLRLTTLTAAELRRIAATKRCGVFDDPLGQWIYPRAQLARVVVRAIDQLVDGLGGGAKYAVRVGGYELRRALGDAAQMCAGAGELDDVLPTPAGDPLATLTRRLIAAHSQRPRPRTPSAHAMQSGTADPAMTPPSYLDDVLLALIGEGVNEARRGTTACVVLDPRARRPPVVELRRLALSDWCDEDDQPLSLAILDATGSVMRQSIEAAMPDREVRLFRLEVPEPAWVRRVHYLTSAVSRRRLFAGARLRARGQDAVVRVLRRGEQELGHRDRPATLGIITHQPLARILLACLAVLDCGADARAAKIAAGAGEILDELQRLRAAGTVGEISLLWYGGQRGANTLASCDALLLLGDPWPDLGAAAEDARALGISAEAHAGALLDAEVAQAIGRGRAVRRTIDRPLLVLYAGREGPACWTTVIPAPAPRGGPTPTEAAVMAELLVADMLGRWGAACPALLHRCAASPGLAEFLDASCRAATADKRESLNSSCRSTTRVTAEQLQTAAELPSSTLRDVFARAASRLGARRVSVPRPSERGVWRMVETRPGAGTLLVGAIKSLASPGDARRPS